MLFGFGEMMPAQFPVPQNPLRYAPSPLALQGMGRFTDWFKGPPGYRLRLSPYTQPEDMRLSGLSGLSGLCGYRRSGMGFLGVDPMSLLLIGGAALALLLLARPGGKEYSREASRARAEYEAKQREIRSRYRGYKRLGRSVKRGAQAAVHAL